MKKLVLIMMLISVLISFCACSNEEPFEEKEENLVINRKEETSLNEIKPENEEDLEDPAISEEITEYIPFDISSVDPTLLEYYEFFGQELGYLGDYSEEKGFAPKAMAMYIFDGFVDPDAEKYGIPKEKFIKISENCFGLNVLELTDFYVDDGTGYIVPAGGYSPSPCAFVLKERTENPDGSVTAVFYSVGWNFDVSYPAPLDEILLSGQFGFLSDSVGVEEYKFFERTDENGNFYAEFISSKSLEPLSMEGIYPVYGS